MSIKAGEYRCKTPVAFLVFNRPDTTKKVFSEIARAKPEKLFVVADGPRHERAGEAERCEAVRKVIAGIDWSCDLYTNYSDANVGCRDRVSSGIDWVFRHVEQAIFLEDDCLPHPSFFRFCDEILETYCDDPRIMAVSGDNFQFGRKRTDYSYYFSRYTHIWGWASWRRAWKHYDVSMSHWPANRGGRWLGDFLENRRETEYWTEVFDLVYQGKIGTWDYQWLFASWLQSALCVIPNVNLVSNIGFGVDATHTGGRGKVAQLPTAEMTFPLKHPPTMLRDAAADKKTAELFFRRPLLSKPRMAISKWLKEG